jgi:hypothetical protein
VGLIAGFQNPVIRFLILGRGTCKVIQAGPAPVAGQRRLRFHMQRQGQNTLRNWLRRAISRRSKRHIEIMMKKK